MTNVNSVKFTGVEISGVRTQQFNYDVSPSGAGTYSYTLNTIPNYRIVSLGWDWTPDTPGDKVYFTRLKPISSGGVGFVTFEAEGSGTLLVYAQAFEGILEYYGQSNPGFL